MKTQRELLVEFADGLHAYARLPQSSDDADAAVRANVCEAHALTVDQILAAPVNAGVHLKVAPEALGVWVTLPAPTGGDPVTVRLADGSDLEAGELDGLGARNLAVIRTLLAVAMNEVNGYGATPQPVYPQVAPPPYYGGPR